MLWEGLQNFCSLKKAKGNIFPMAPVMGNGTFPQVAVRDRSTGLGARRPHAERATAPLFLR